VGGGDCIGNGRDVLPISMNGLEGGLLVIPPLVFLEVLLMILADDLPNPVDLAVGIPSMVEGVFASGFDFRLRNKLDKSSSNGSLDESEEEEPSAAVSDLGLESDFGLDGSGGTWLKNDPDISSFLLVSSSLEDDDDKDKDTSL